mmetsp:Transcript_54375/g.151480  ORF Transcript_54375/g.151480 Transcript_54375/m.151480 type:complete len:345 (-) Transcript_54375:50-1084(-)
MVSLARTLGRRGRFRRPVQTKAITTGLSAVWASSGVGPAAIGLWTRLSAYPPFSFVPWIIQWVLGWPKFARVYFMYSLADSLAKWLFPGLYLQITTGTWLGILATVSPKAYTRSVVQRLQQLLLKQVALRRKPGEPAPQLSQATLTAAETHLAEDPVLAQALGSMAILGIWHRMEKLPLDSPVLLESVPRDSQARWVLEALRASYFGDIEAAMAETNLNKAADDATKCLSRLREAVDTVAFKARHGVVQAGSEATKALVGVEQATAAAAKAMKALDEARAKAGHQPRLTNDPVARDAWLAKIRDLSSVHSGCPEVMAELLKLQSVAEASSSASGNVAEATAADP